MKQKLVRYIDEKDWQAAQLVTRTASLQSFSKDQLTFIRFEAHKMYDWKKRHWKLHNLINVSVLLGILISDAVIVLSWGPWLAQELNLIFAIVFCGLIHSFLAYSLVNFSLHEGAAHDAIISVKGPISKFLSKLANNSCRLYFSDPVFYEINHQLHHQKFASKEDGAFSNFVGSRRILKSLMPFAMLFNLTDYKIHSGMKWTKSRFLSAVVGGIYFLTYFALAARQVNFIYALMTLGFLGTWIGFVLDRFRESSEHCLMPLNTLNGSRSLGVGFWAMLIGGGPWGQPCHLSHHLAPQLTWYHQIQLHFVLLEIMTKEQKDFFIMEEGFSNFPSFWQQTMKKIKSAEQEILKSS